MRIKKTAMLILAICLIMVTLGCSDDSGQSESETGHEIVNFSSFEASDLEGNPVSGSVLKEADLTVLNIWATYCGPCLEEMPGLAELAKEYEGKGIQFIGIPADAVSQDLLTTAREIVSETGTGYLQIAPSEELYSLYLSQVASVPETLLINKEGRIIESLVGARSKEEWKAIIDGAYEQVK